MVAAEVERKLRGGIAQYGPARSCPSNQRTRRDCSRDSRTTTCKKTYRASHSFELITDSTGRMELESGRLAVSIVRVAQRWPDP